MVDGGKGWQCRVKLRESQRQYSRRNWEKKLEAQRRWREANPEKQRDYGRRHYAANREKRRESSRRWRESNPEKAAEQKRRRRESDYYWRYYIAVKRPKALLEQRARIVEQLEVLG